MSVYEHNKSFYFSVFWQFRKSPLKKYFRFVAGYEKAKLKGKYKSRRNMTEEDMRLNDLMFSKNKDDPWPFPEFSDY